MSITLLFLCLFAGGASAAIRGRLVTFPYAATPCTCTLLSCTCCTGIQVPKIGFQKNVCVVLGINILSLKISVTIKLDNKILSQFSFSALSPPQYCIPVLLPINLSMCLKLHDIKITSGPGIQMCMTLYGGYGGKNNFVIPFNCVSVQGGSLQYFTTSSTTTTTKKPATVAATTQAVTKVAATTTAPVRAVVATPAPEKIATDTPVRSAIATSSPVKVEAATSAALTRESLKG